MKRCFFIGHRDAPGELYPRVLAAVGAYIRANGEVEFLVGRYGRFDAMATRAVIARKQENPAVRLTQLVPYLPAKPLLPGFDGALIPPGLEFVPRRAAIVYANQYAARTCDALIAYAKHPASNAWNLLAYVQPRIQRGELTLIRLT